MVYWLFGRRVVRLSADALIVCRTTHWGFVLASFIIIITIIIIIIIIIIISIIIFIIIIIITFFLETL